MTQASEGFRAEDVNLNDTSTDSSESFHSDSSSRNGSEASSSDSGALNDTSTFDGGALSDASTPDSGSQTPTAVRTSARQLGANISGPDDGEEIWEGRTRTQTRALNREAATGPICLIGPCEGGRISRRYWQQLRRGARRRSCQVTLSKRRSRNRRLISPRVRHSSRTFRWTR